MNNFKREKKIVFIESLYGTISLSACMLIQIVQLLESVANANAYLRVLLLVVATLIHALEFPTVILSNWYKFQREKEREPNFIEAINQHQLKCVAGVSDNKSSIA